MRVDTFSITHTYTYLWGEYKRKREGGGISLGGEKRENKKKENDFLSFSVSSDITVKQKRKLLPKESCIKKEKKNFVSFPVT